MKQFDLNLQYASSHEDNFTLVLFYMCNHSLPKTLHKKTLQKLRM